MAASNQIANDKSTTGNEADEAELDKLYKRVIVEVRGHEPAVLKSYTKFIQMAADGFELNANLEIKDRERFIERWSILKSKFGKKKHFRQYEMRTHFKIYEFKHLTGSTADTLLEYIQRNLPEGVAMHVTKVELLPLPESLHQAPATQ